MRQKLLYPYRVTYKVIEKLYEEPIDEFQHTMTIEAESIRQIGDFFDIDPKFYTMLAKENREGDTEDPDVYEENKDKIYYELQIVDIVQDNTALALRYGEIIWKSLEFLNKITFGKDSHLDDHVESFKKKFKALKFMAGYTGLTLVTVCCLKTFEPTQYLGQGIVVLAHAALGGYTLREMYGLNAKFSFLTCILYIFIVVNSLGG